MNETGSTLGSFSFVEATENEGLDIQAFFGHAETDNDTNLFDEPQETRAAPASPEPKSTTAESVVSTVADNVIQMAFQQQEAENTQKGLFDKPPVFSYGGVKEDIKDTAMTFEELRIAKSEDFPELSDGKKVSWTVEYGKTVKAIADPKGTTILSVKKEVEQSPDFLNNLKKSKDKNPSCLVKPKVISQSKGIASYKGIFSTVEEARASDKNICLIPAKDGRVYELRKTEMGEFLVPKDNIAEFSTVRAGFIPALPRIPRRLIQQSVAFFRYFIGEKESFEALLHVYWDRKAMSFVLDVPHQQVSTVCLDADLQTKALPGERYLHYADIHSHNRMEARFSQADDLDELATRIYIVIGHLDRYFPTVAARISCGGVFYPIALGEVAEPIGEDFPTDWLGRVKMRSSKQGLFPEVNRISSCDNSKYKAKAILAMDQNQLQSLEQFFRYQLLDRLRQDCEYYLGDGNRRAHYLWAGTERQHITLMKSIWQSFAPEERPSWLSISEIEGYEANMLNGGCGL